LSRPRYRQRRISRSSSHLHVCRVISKPARSSQIGRAAKAPGEPKSHHHESTSAYWGNLKEQGDSWAAPQHHFLADNVPDTETRIHCLINRLPPESSRHHGPFEAVIPSALDDGMVYGKSHAKTAYQQKRFGLSDPVVWDAINRNLAQQRRMASVLTSSGQTPDPKCTGPSSRSPSERKALNRFTNRLDRYAQASRQAGQPIGITPTESQSRISLHTLQPLLPYHEEFRAAGLAVTSTEQMCVNGVLARKKGSKHRAATAQHLVRHNDVCIQDANTVGDTVEDAIGDTEPTDVPCSEQANGAHSRREAEDDETSKKDEQRNHCVNWSRFRRVRERLNPKIPASNAGVGKQDEVPRLYKDRQPRSNAVFQGRGSDTVRRSRFREHVLAPDIFTGSSQSRPNESREGNIEADTTPLKTLQHDLARQTKQTIATRDGAQARSPRPLTIREEAEPQRQLSVPQSSSIRPKPATEKPGIPSAARSTSPTPGSSVPTLPSIARLVGGSSLSLERTLNAVAETLQSMEDEIHLTANPRLDAQPPVCSGTPQTQRLDAPKSTHTTQMSCDKALPPPPVVSARHKKADLVAPIASGRPRSRQLLSDLDAFFGSDDADVDKGHILKGLRVAVQAATDDVYDAHIRITTGLRIRRFLADLRSVDVMQEGSSSIPSPRRC